MSYLFVAGGLYWLRFLERILRGTRLCTSQRQIYQKLTCIDVIPVDMQVHRRGY